MNVRTGRVAVVGSISFLAAASAIVLALSVRIPVARATVVCDSSWTGAAANGNWFDAGNWDAGVPTSLTNACLPGTGAYGVRIQGNAHTASLTIDTGPTLTIENTNNNDGSSLDGIITNAGTILVTTPDNCIGCSESISGNVTNTGTLDVESGQPAMINGPLDNQGTFTVGQSVTLQSPGATYANTGTITIASGKTLLVQTADNTNPETFNFNGGTIANDGTWRQVGGSLNHNGGNATGNLPMLRTVAIAPDPGLGSATFFVTVDSTLASNVSSSDTLVIVNDVNNDPGSLHVASNHSNAGTIQLSSINGCGGCTPNLDVDNGSVLTNTGTLDVAAGNPAFINGNVTDTATGAVNVASQTTIQYGTFDLFGTLTVANGVTLTNYADTLNVEPGGTFTLNTTGTYTQDSTSSSAALGVTVDATGPTSYTGITGGHVNVDGTLQVTTVGTPALGSLWEIIDGTTSGSFGAYQFGSTSYAVHYASVTLEALGSSATVTEPSTSSGGVTAVPPGGLPLGSTLYDHATVTGNSSTVSPGGTVTFYECGPSATSCTNVGTPVGSPVPLTAGSNGTATADSTGFVPPSAGTWCFAGYYSGDATFPASSDTSSDECFTVNAAQQAFSQLDPTSTTCQLFVASPTPSNNIGPLSYGLRSGKINTVNPGVFFYYSEFSASAGTTVDLLQSNDGPKQANGTTPWPNFQPAKSQVVLYDASCNVLSSRKFTKTTVTVGGNANVQQIAVTIPQSATGSVFIIGIKFDSTSIDGTQPVAHTKPTVLYSFSTVIGSTTESSAQLTLQAK